MTVLDQGQTILALDVYLFECGDAADDGQQQQFTVFNTTRRMKLSSRYVCSLTAEG